MTYDDEDSIIPWNATDEPDHRPRRPLMAALGACVAAGIITAGLITPAAVPVALGARNAVSAFNDLPSELPNVALPQKSEILAADGSKIATFWSQNREEVKLDQVSPTMRKAIVAIEDSRFYEHGAVDIRGILRAVVKDGQSGGAAEGASTLTQQYVKNVLLLAAADADSRAEATEVSLERKLREARLALAVEQKYSKDEILEKYLNIAYFGSGAYGVEAASQHYFGIPSAKLNLTQSALLAGIVQSPSYLDPTSNPTAATARRTKVLTRMLETGAITREQYEKANAAKLGLHVTAQKNGCAASRFQFYCDYVRTSLEKDPALGATEQEREARLRQGGLTIKTALDPKVQKKAQQAVNDRIPTSSKVSSAIVVVQPGTGRVQAMAVSRPYGTDDSKNQTVIPLATKPAYQPGSSFKAFTIATAVEKGISTDLRLPSSGCYHSRIFDNPSSGAFCNSTSAGSYPTMKQAAAMSVNTYFVQLQEKVGTLDLAEMAARAGVTSLPLSGPHAIRPREGALTLGDREVSPLDMANAYATFAARGKRCDATPFVKVTRNDGKPMPATPTKCEQVMAPAVADSVSDVLTNVITSGTGRANANIGRPAAGKTGTTNDAGAAWFVGYTPDAAAAVWIGDPRGAASHPLQNVLGRSVMHGGDIPAAIWHDTMLTAEKGKPVRHFPTPNPAGLLSTQQLLPDLAGLPIERARQILTDAGFTVTNGKKATGTVKKTQPGAGTPVPPGAKITLVK